MGHWKLHHSINRIQVPIEFYGNYDPILYCFWDINSQTMAQLWNHGRGHSPCEFML